jgi:hypothetical protein
MNKALLCKWLWRLENPHDKGLWKDIIFSRYKNRRSSINMSPFWREVKKEELSYQTSISKSVGKGQNIFFWKDRWLSDCPLDTVYPLLYEIASNKNLTVSYVISYNIFYLTFTRLFDNTLQEELISLYSSLSNIILIDQEDNIKWRWNNTDKFTTNSCYQWLEFGGIVDPPYKRTWSAHIPLKIKIFLWLDQKKKI